MKAFLHCCMYLTHPERHQVAHVNSWTILAGNAGLEIGTPPTVIDRYNRLFGKPRQNGTSPTRGERRVLFTMDSNFQATSRVDIRQLMGKPAIGRKFLCNFARLGLEIHILLHEKVSSAFCTSTIRFLWTGCVVSSISSLWYVLLFIKQLSG